MLKDSIKFNTKKMSKWTAILLLGLLAGYYIVTVVNTNNIAKQVEMISNHPFPVVIAAGEVETGVAQLRSLPERLFYSHSPEVIETIGEYYDTIDASITENLKIIMEKYTYTPDDSSALEQAYESLREEQNKLLTLCINPDFTYEDTERFYKENIEPKADEIDRSTAQIIQGAKMRFVDLEQLSRQSKLDTILFSTVLMVAVIAALFIYLFLLKNKSKREEEMRFMLRDTLQSAQNANAAKSQFLSNMSHDIRTPMNAIIGMTAIAGLHLEEPEKVKDCLNKISVSSKHLLGLINDVLDMSKIESGKIALNEEEIVFPELVHSFITIVQPQVKGKQLELDISMNGVKHEKVVGDALRINQILLNIMGNAIKFTPAGGTVYLKISEMPVQHNGYGTYQFTVKDTGIGMPDEFLQRIFKPFERVQTSTNSKIEGTGLGMAITKSIVDMMNGQIVVQSEMGKGSTFIVTLHLKLQQTGEQGTDLQMLPEFRLLVVDDDKDVCENTTEMLEEIGMRSEWVLDGVKAVEKVLEAHQIDHDYHSVIIDWKMPGMDGLETTRRIRKIVGNETPIIILTAYDWTEIEEEAKEAGVNAFLAKPLFKSQLYHVIHDIVLGEKTDMEADTNGLDTKIVEGRVLLVEDNAVNMEIAREFIQGSGAVAEEAWDGSDALRMLRDAPNGYYKLIFMDIQMPRMNGYEATRRIRQIEQSQGRVHTPIVAMSANAFMEDVDKAYAAGMDAYITKPVNIDEINGVLKKYLTKA